MSTDPILRARALAADLRAELSRLSQAAPKDELLHEVREAAADLEARLAAYAAERGTADPGLPDAPAPGEAMDRSYIDPPEPDRSYIDPPEPDAEPGAPA